MTSPSACDDSSVRTTPPRHGHFAIRWSGGCGAIAKRFPPDQRKRIRLIDNLGTEGAVLRERRRGACSHSQLCPPGQVMLPRHSEKAEHLPHRARIVPVAERDLPGGSES